MTSEPGAGGALIRLVRPHLPAYRRLIAVTIGLQLVQNVAVLYLPTLNAEIVDNGVLHGDTGYIVRLGGVMIAVSAIQVICLVGAVRYSARAAMSVGRDIRAAIFGRVQRFSSREIGHFGTPSLITRTTNDVQQVQTLVLAVLAMLVSAPIMGVGGVVLALGQDVPLTMLLLVLLPVLSVLMIAIIRPLMPLFRTMQKHLDAVNLVLREQITGIGVIHAFAKEEFEQRRFGLASAELADVSLRAGRLTTLMFPLAATVVNLFSVPVVWLGAYLIDGGSMRIGALIAFLGYLTVILGAVVTGTFVLMAVPRAEACAERILEVLDTEPSLAVAAAPVTRLPRPGHAELRGVSFSYPGAEATVLRGVDLIARPGEITAVVGSTGSGKSTLIGLMPRLADATSGHVLVGGEDVRNTDPSVLAAAVGLVPQTAYLFAGTIASNLRYGRPDATDDELWRALEIAQARDFVEQLHGGLGAPVSQGGRNLSGGQRQRIGIARALVLRPRIYLFDDSFSALDFATEARLRARLAEEVADAAVVTVAQRVATVRNADRIIVLEAGVVVGTGTHDELAAANPVYQEIVSSQLADEQP
jgi:ATP-binding cassette, subfamily B, multidrug efflux pump